MVRAWVFNEKAEGDQRSHHYPVPFEPVPLSRLAQLGVLYFTMNPADVAANPDGGEIGELRKQRGYKNYDIITISKDKLPNYEEKLAIFFKEHLHEDEEIRFVLDGQGYFDVRDDTTAEWIRIETVKGDMIVLPEGMYHRFTLDLTNYIQAMRLFKEAPKWEAINRGLLAETTGSRHLYTNFIQTSLHKPIVPPFSVALHPSNGSTALTLDNHAAALANYPHARRYQGVIYVSGLSSRRADNTHRGAVKQEDGTFVLDIAEQTRGVLENMRTVLATAGATLDDVIDVSVYLVNMKDYNDFNQVYNTYFSNPATAPTRTTVAVHQLPHPNLLIEIKAVAADPQARASVAASSSSSSSSPATASQSSA